VGMMPAPSTKNPAVPPALDALVASCLAKDPAARPQSAGDVGNALEVWLSNQPQPGRLAFEAWLTSNSGLFEPDGLATAGRVTTPRRTPVSAAKPISTPSLTPAGEQPVLRKVRSMSMGASSSLPSTTPLTSTSWTSSSATPSPVPLASMGGLSLASKGSERKRSLVLYVEDEPENREVAELRLRRSYDLLLAATDEIACTMLRERGPELSAILMDIQLKGSILDGIELVKLVRGTLPEGKKPPWAKNVPVLPDLPIFFVTAYGARYAEAELLAVGAQKLVTKPVNFSELTLALVDVHLRRAGKP
jgi:CheY-like chemotaxis protein